MNGEKGKLIVIIVTGMPGSGKTTLLNRWKKEGRINDFCDSYQYGAIDKSRDPRKSQHFKHLLKGLRVGETWAVCDIRYCDKNERAILVRALKEAMPGLKFRYVYFENRPDLCEHNVIVRESGLAPHEKGLIYYYTDIYDIPKNAKPLPIHRA